MDAVLSTLIAFGGAVIVYLLKENQSLKTRITDLEDRVRQKDKAMLKMAAVIRDFVDPRVDNSKAVETANRILEELESLV